MGCSSSKTVEVYSTKAPRPLEQPDDAHLVALTSSTYGILRLDSQKRTDEASSEVDDPVNQMYQKMMSLDAAGSQLPQSWSEVSSKLSKLKTEAQSKAVVTRLALPTTQPETVDVSKLLESAEDTNLAIIEQPKPKPALGQPGHKRDVSIIHTLEEVDKLAESVTSPPETDSDVSEDELPTSYYSTRTLESGSNRVDKRFSMSSVVQRPKLEEKLNKPSKSLSYNKRMEQQENGGSAEPDSTLFDAEFLESFKEAFAQLSNGVPSTERRITARGNKISQPDKTKVAEGVKEAQQQPAGKVSLSKTVQQPAERKPVQKKTTGEFQSKLVPPKAYTPVQKTLQPSDFGGQRKVKAQIKTQEQEPVQVQQQAVEQEKNTSVQSRVANWQKAPETTSSRQKEIPVFSNKKTAPKTLPYDPLLQFQRKCPPEGEQKVVLYLTSLRGIRKTFEDCSTVRNILQSFNVEVDERDVSMDGQFRQELKDLMEKPVPVPRLFIKGRYIGGADEVVQFHENGTLAKLVEGMPKGNFTKECDGCGGVRFIPCTDCSGSCKAVGANGSVIKCPECNENGLVRCPICS